MPTINPTLPNDGESIDAIDVNTPFEAILALLNGGLDGDNINTLSLPWSVMATGQTNKIPASMMEDSGDLELYRLGAGINFINSGGVWSQVSALNGQMTALTFFSTNGNYYAVSAVATHAFTASKDTYVSVAPTGTITYQEVTNGSSAPALGSGYQWLAKVVTDGSGITSVADIRNTKPGESRSFTTSWVGAGGNPSIGNGTLVARYAKQGKMVTMWIYMTAGSTTSFGSGVYTFALPFFYPAANNGTDFYGAGFAGDFGSAEYPIVARILPNGTTANMITTSGNVSVTPTVPFTFGNQDVLRFQITYETTI